MTLYTAEGLIEAHKSGVSPVAAIRDSYLAWFGSQVGKKVNVKYDSKFVNIPGLNVRRAPGNTCLAALNDIHRGIEPHNFSKGCGGIMRVAPIGVYGASHGWGLEETGRLAGEVAEITHKHKMSTFASAVQAMIVQQCILFQGDVDVSSFKNIVGTAVAKLPMMYPGNETLLEDFNKLIQKAIRLEDNLLQDWEIIENGLGGGWVAEETLAIAIFSVLRHIDDFKACLIWSVNHGGDSDSTGAVAGNIIGAILGYNAIPKEFTKHLQFHNLIIETADSLIK